ncbi:hypothetical protein, partial [Paenibacillus sp. O199]|uniref:hypothetical protein n=2 Tax=unclassified Paenibacillus TaxID=185978 RepID=UPI0019679604
YYLYKQIDAGWTSGWGQLERYMNAGHEIGHILGLNHFENAPAHSGDHWMKSGKYKLTSPTATDLAHERKNGGGKHEENYSIDNRCFFSNWARVLSYSNSSTVESKNDSAAISKNIDSIAKKFAPSVVRTDKIEANHAIFTNADDAESQ